MAGYRPSLTEARAAMDAPLDPEMEFDYQQQVLAEAEKAGRIPRLSSQERNFLSLYRMGLTWQQASRGAGMSVGEAQAFMRDPRCESAGAIVKEMNESKIVVTKDLLTFQYYEAIASAETSAEKIRGLDSVAKIHEIGGFARQGTVAKEEAKLVGDGLTPEAKKKKLSTMTTERLLEEAGIEDGFFDPIEIERD